MQETDEFSGVNNLFYKNEFLFFIATNEDGQTSYKDVFYKNVPKTGEVTDIVTRVTEGLDGLVSVSALDEFIYVACSS